MYNIMHIYGSSKSRFHLSRKFFAMMTMETLAVQLDDILSRLPADLTYLIDTASLNPESFSHGNIILRLTITLLNETDKRISNMVTFFKYNFQLSHSLILKIYIFIGHKIRGTCFIFCLSSSVSDH